MSDDSRSQGTSVGDALLVAIAMVVIIVVVLLAAISVFLFSPGMLVISLVRLMGREPALSTVEP